MKRIEIRALLLLVFALATGGLPVCAVMAENSAALKVVVIDAGHGGNDPGAVANEGRPNQVREMDITLKVALRLGKLIEERMPGTKVIYTRKTAAALHAEKNRDLQMRADVANRAGADVFVSIHVNAATSTAASGTETFVIGDNSTAKARSEEVLYETNRDELIDMSDSKTAATVRAYLQNLQFLYGEYSEALAGYMQRNYLANNRRSRGVRSQPFKVLYAVNMPSVLTEIGFISNARELAYIKSEKGQNEIAAGLCRSLEQYAKFVRLAGEDGEGPEAQGRTPDTPTAQPDTQGAQPAARPEMSPIVEPRSDTPKKETEQPAAQPAKPGAQPAPTTTKPTVPTAKPTTPPAAQNASPRRYGVQLMAAATAVSINSSQFRDYRGCVKQYRGDGRFGYKYCVGEFQTRAEAQKYLSEVRKVFPLAFVVGFEGTQIVK